MSKTMEQVSQELRDVHTKEPSKTARLANFWESQGLTAQELRETAAELRTYRERLKAMKQQVEALSSDAYNSGFDIGSDILREFEEQVKTLVREEQDALRAATKAKP